MGDGLSPVILVFDEGPGAGLGHRSRMTAVAEALRRRGVAVRLRRLESALVIDGDVVVIDSYRIRADDEAVVRAGHVVALDDLARDLAVDVVVDPSPGATEASHPRAGAVLAGPSYALLAPEIASVAGRPVGGPVERVLVTMGGTDESGVGAAMAKRLAALLPDIEITMVVGPWSSPGDAGDAVVVTAPPSLASLLASADIVLTAGGVTLLEAMCLARPVVAVVLADNQRVAVEHAARAGGAVAVDLEHAVGDVVRLVDDGPRRVALSVAAAGLVDGRGAERVADRVVQLLEATA